jgi:hypothetical protein
MALKKLLLMMLCCFINRATVASKWVVVTSINHPTKALEKLAVQEGWHVVVVGDKKTPADWHLPNSDYLSIEKQQELGYNITKLLPWNHYCRKNIGYLYAIQQGATIIYDTDDDNILNEEKIVYFPKKITAATYQTTKPTVNVYSHFGQPSVWPRGYPLAYVMDKVEDTFKSQDLFVPIQQGLADEDPDVDAIFRLTRSLDINFTHAEPVGLPTGVMCPFNSQNTIFHYEAFWGLLIPVTTRFRVCDIWRGYFAQRLLWDIGANLLFIEPTVYQKRNEHNLMHDFIDEIDLYRDAGRLVDYLKAWKSDKNNIFDRMIDLVTGMVSQKFYREAEIAFMQAWMEDLKTIGYNPPACNNRL